jgi:hypothetical protein
MKIENHDSRYFKVNGLLYRKKDYVATYENVNVSESSNEFVAPGNKVVVVIKEKYTGSIILSCEVEKIFNSVNVAYTSLASLINDLKVILDDNTLTSIGPTGPAGPQGPVGPAGLRWRGSWVSGTSYIADDAVGYNGASYFCILATSGTSNPTVATSNWALLASQGAVGPAGPTGATGATGPQGPIGVATQTLQDTINLGNTVTTTNYQSFISSASFAVSNLITNDESFLAADKLSFTKAGANSLEIIPPSSLSAARTIQFPDNNGTVALLSDISSSSPSLQSVHDVGNTISAGSYQTVLSAGQILTTFAGGGTAFLEPDRIVLNNGTSYVALSLPNTLTGNQLIKFPNETGTLAVGTIVTKTLKTTISQAQVLQLFTTPIVVLPAPSAGKVNIPTNLYIRRNVGNSYTLVNNSLQLLDQFNNDTQNTINPNPLASNQVGYINSTLYIVDSVTGTATTGAYKLKAVGGNPTGGTGSLDVYVTYNEITL